MGGRLTGCLLALSLLVLVACGERSADETTDQAVAATATVGPAPQYVIGKVYLPEPGQPLAVEVVDPLRSGYDSTAVAAFTRPLREVRFSGQPFRTDQGWTSTSLLRLTNTDARLLIENFGPTYKNKKRIVEIRGGG